MTAKGIGGWILTTSSILLAISIYYEVIVDYEYSNSVGSYWELSVKASTLEQKAEYLDRFVLQVTKAELSGNNAIWLKTPDNSIEQNMIALHSLQTRMNEIKGMDVQSFQYQQAISQITSQEQDEAHRLLEVISGCWYLKYHWLMWGWIDVVKWIFLVILLIVGIIILIATWDD